MILNNNNCTFKDVKIPLFKTESEGPMLTNESAPSVILFRAPNAGEDGTETLFPDKRWEKWKLEEKYSLLSLLKKFL